MSSRSLFALPLVGAVVLFVAGSALAEPPPVPEEEEPVTHTMTINNGTCVVEKTFVWENGSWRLCTDSDRYDVFCRDCPRSPWCCHGTYSPCRAKEVACSLRACGNLACVRRRVPCPGDECGRRGAAVCHRPPLARWRCR
jgi:hypothetical protein